MGPNLLLRSSISDPWILNQPRKIGDCQTQNLWKKGWALTLVTKAIRSELPLTICRNCFFPVENSKTRALTQGRMDLSDLILNKIVKCIPILGALLLGYNTYLQILLNKGALLSAFSVAVFLTFLVSIGSIAYGHSLPRQGSEKEKATAARVVACLFASIGAALLIRAWTVLPPERSWLVPASCTIPISALMAFVFFRRSLANSS